MTRFSFLAFGLTLLFLPRAANSDPRIDALLEGLPKTARVSIEIASRRRNKVIYSRSPNQALRPASNMKLITLGLAIEELGPDFRQTTSLIAGTPVCDSQIAGSVYIVGRGDPNLSRRFEHSSNKTKDVPILAQWAQILVRRGVRRITGDIVGDDRYFDSERFHPDWEPADRPHWYAAEISALTLNDNCVDIEVRPAPGGGKVTLIPPTRYITIKQLFKKAATSRTHRFSIHRRGTTHNVTVKGNIWPKAGPGRGEITISNPALFFATAFRESLERAGIKVLGKARTAKPGETLPKGEVLSEHSTQLPLTLSICGKRSLNHYAESLLKTVAKVRSGTGSFTQGTKLATSFLGRIGAPTKTLILRDGSGLSRKNQISARALRLLLEHMWASPNNKLFRSSLAVGGIDGTLRRRFRTLPKGARLEAKTGTLRDTSALSGYLHLPPGSDGHRDTLVFSIILNNVPRAKRLEERILSVFIP